MGIAATTNDKKQNMSLEFVVGRCFGFSCFGSRKLNSHPTKPWTQTKKINESLSLDRIFHTIGNPMQTVAIRRGRSDHVDALGVVGGICSK